MSIRRRRQSEDADHLLPSIPAQLVEQLRELITQGTLRPGDPLPSTRALAARLGISRGSASTAYDQLAAEGLITADTGGSRVNPALPLPAGGPTGAPHPRLSLDQRDQQEKPAVQIYDLRPGRPDTTGLATTAWRAAWRAAAADPSLGPPAVGSRSLRDQLAEYLRTSRSVPADPADLLVTAGARDGLRTLLSAASALCGRPLTIAVENPGYPSLHRVPTALGHRVVPVPVDEHGLNPRHLQDGASRPDLVLITPSHQYPLGASMPAARRVELIRWAVQHQALIVEDDYDSELRYVGDPLPALATLDTPELGSDGRVVTLGSFAKTLTPGLGLGFLLVPSRLRDPVQAMRHDLGAPVSGVLQDAMAAYFAGGGVRRHTARMRREYKNRRSLLAEVLAPDKLPPGAEVLPMDGGLHAVIALPEAAAEEQVRDAAARRGVLVAGLSEYWSGGIAGSRAGVVVGFGGLSRHRLQEGLEQLREALLEVGSFNVPPAGPDR